ncbi:glycosyltransferase [Faecalibacterium prausnitzii]
MAFVDSDDTITPDFCAKLYHAAQEAGAQMAVCNYRQVDEALTPIR